MREERKNSDFGAFLFGKSKNCLVKVSHDDATISINEFRSLSVIGLYEFRPQ